MYNFKIGDFVTIHHPHCWDDANKLGILNNWEKNNPEYLTGIIKGTYGPWESVPKSRLMWDIIPDSWILKKYGGSCQIYPERVKIDFLRNRTWNLSILTNDLSDYISSDKNEYVIEKISINNYFNKNGNKSI